MEKNLEKKLPEIKALFVQYGVERAFIFGSAAKGTSTEKSDVDFLFKFPNGIHYELYSNQYFGLYHALKKLLNREVDLVAEKTLTNPYLIESINESKIQIL